MSYINTRLFGGAKEWEWCGKRKSQGIGSVTACGNMRNGELDLRMRLDWETFFPPIIKFKTRILGVVGVTFIGVSLR